MKEGTLRRWHRRAGILLALLIILQAGSGLLITLHEWPLLQTLGQGGSSQGLSSTHETDESQWADALEFIHRGLANVGAVYRIVTGLGILWMVISGTLIFFKIRARTRGVARKEKG